jgi:segregation and condensation protein A
MPDWTSLLQFLPDGVAGELFGRSALASTLVAALQLTKEGKISLRQSAANGPIYLRASSEEPERES